jgi:DNA-binding MarR family transcriptional regulator
MKNDVDVSAWRALLLAQSRVVRAIERDLDAAGAIPLGWYDVLLELNAAPERQLRMQDLAARAVLSRTRVSRIVTELADAGYVERREDPADRRAWLATLTPEGRAELEATAPRYLAGIEQHFNRHLTAAERRAIATALDKVVDAHRAEMDLRR